MRLNLFGRKKARLALLLLGGALALYLLSGPVFKYYWQQHFLRKMASCCSWDSVEREGRNLRLRNVRFSHFATAEEVVVTLHRHPRWAPSAEVELSGLTLPVAAVEGIAQEMELPFSHYTLRGARGVENGREVISLQGVFSVQQRRWLWADVELYDAPAWLVRGELTGLVTGSCSWDGERLTRVKMQSSRLVFADRLVAEEVVIRSGREGIELMGSLTLLGTEHGTPVASWLQVRAIVSDNPTSAQLFAQGLWRGQRHAGTLRVEGGERWVAEWTVGEVISCCTLSSESEELRFVGTNLLPDQISLLSSWLPDSLGRLRSLVCHEGVLDITCSWNREVSGGVEYALQRLAGRDLFFSLPEADLYIERLEVEGSGRERRGRITIEQGLAEIYGARSLVQGESSFSLHELEIAVEEGAIQHLFADGRLSQEEERWMVEKQAQSGEIALRANMRLPLHGSRKMAVWDLLLEPREGVWWLSGRVRQNGVINVEGIFPSLWLQGGVGELLSGTPLHVVAGLPGWRLYAGSSDLSLELWNTLIGRGEFALLADDRGVQLSAALREAQWELPFALLRRVEGVQTGPLRQPMGGLAITWSGEVAGEIALGNLEVQEYRTGVVALLQDTKVVGGRGGLHLQLPTIEIGPLVAKGALAISKGPKLRLILDRLSANVRELLEFAHWKPEDIEIDGLVTLAQSQVVAEYEGGDPVVDLPLLLTDLSCPPLTGGEVAFTYRYPQDQLICHRGRGDVEKYALIVDEFLVDSCRSRTPCVSWNVWLADEEGERLRWVAEGQLSTGSQFLVHTNCAKSRIGACLMERMDMTFARSGIEGAELHGKVAVGGLLRDLQLLAKGEMLQCPPALLFQAAKVADKRATLTFSFTTRGDKSHYFIESDRPVLAGGEEHLLLRGLWTERGGSTRYVVEELQWGGLSLSAEWYMDRDVWRFPFFGLRMDPGVLLSAKGEYHPLQERLKMEIDLLRVRLEDVQESGSLPGWLQALSPGGDLHVEGPFSLQWGSKVVADLEAQWDNPTLLGQICEDLHDVKICSSTEDGRLHVQGLSLRGQEEGGWSVERGEFSIDPWTKSLYFTDVEWRVPIASLLGANQRLPMLSWAVEGELHPSRGEFFGQGSVVIGGKEWPIAFQDQVDDRTGSHRLSLQEELHIYWRVGEGDWRVERVEGSCLGLTASLTRPEVFAPLSGGIELHLPTWEGSCQLTLHPEQAVVERLVAVGEEDASLQVGEGTLSPGFLALRGIELRNLQHPSLAWKVRSLQSPDLQLSLAEEPRAEGRVEVDFLLVEREATAQEWLPSSGRVTLFFQGEYASIEKMEEVLGQEGRIQYVLREEGSPSTIGLDGSLDLQLLARPKRGLLKVVEKVPLKIRGTLSHPVAHVW